MAEKITITSYDQQGNIPKDFTGEVTTAVPGYGTPITRTYIKGAEKTGTFGNEQWLEGVKVSEWDALNKKFQITDMGLRLAKSISRPGNRAAFSDPAYAKQAIQLLESQGQSVPDWLRAAAQGQGVSSSTDGTLTDGSATGTYTASDGKTFTNADAYVAYQGNLDNQKANRQSAYDLLYQQFSEYGLGELVTPLKGLIESGISPSEFTLRLRDTDAYKKRFAANAQRINKGLRALSEAEYIALEDQYQNVMRNYGLPESYYAKGDMGTQAGFEKFIAGDVSAAELEDRIQTAQNRVLYANPEVATALKQFYPDITNGDILAYALDPQQALTNIKRKVTAAEIGAGALQAGLATGVSRAEELQKYGVTGETARQGYQAIAGYLPRASTLGDIYAKQGMGPFTQGTAEAEVFGTPGAAEAATKRRKLSELEQASFSGSAGRAGGALARERAGQF